MQLQLVYIYGNKSKRCRQEKWSNSFFCTKMQIAEVSGPIVEIFPNKHIFA